MCARGAWSQAPYPLTGVSRTGWWKRPLPCQCNPGGWPPASTGSTVSVRVIPQTRTTMAIGCQSGCHDRLVARCGCGDAAAPLGSSPDLQPAGLVGASATDDAAASTSRAICRWLLRLAVVRNREVPVDQPGLPTHRLREANRYVSHHRPAPASSWAVAWSIAPVEPSIAWDILTGRRLPS